MHRLAPPLLVTGLFCTALTLRVSLAGAPLEHPSAPALTQSAQSAQAAAQPDYNALIDKYCVECHNARG